MQPLHVVGESAQDESTQTDRIFGHWVYMLSKNPRRVALGQTRRKVIEKALAMYDEDTLMLAIEGCAASAWHAGDNDRRQAYDDLELVLRNEANIERFAAWGESLRNRASYEVEERVRCEAEQVDRRAEPDPQAIAARRELLRETAARIAGRKVRS